MHQSLYTGPCELFQSYKVGFDCIGYHLPHEADKLLNCRVQIINVWRPIYQDHPRDPLAVMSTNAVEEEELVSIKPIYPNCVGETFAVRPEKEGRTHGGHKENYSFKSNQCFDPETDGRARRVPYSSFINQEFKDEVSRDNIEVRTLVFHPVNTN